MPKKIIRQWTDPCISPKNTTDKNAGTHCYVWFRYLNPETGQWSNPIKRKPAITLPWSKRSHYLNLKALIRAFEIKLSIEGWNPIDDSYPNNEPIEVDAELLRIKKLSFIDALDYAFQKKKPDWSHRSVQCYESVVKYLKQYARFVGIHNKKTEELDIAHYKLLLEKIKEKRKLTPMGFNRYRTYLSTLITEMKQWQIVTKNVIEDVRTKPEEKRMAHRPPTKDERLIITTTMRKHHPEYFRFLAVLYGCTLRPDEITRLQISHLHKKEGVFKVPSSNTKNKTYRMVTIPNWVMDLLMELNLQNYPPDYYIFSTTNIKSFVPGKRKMHANTTSHWWRKIVKNKKTGLGLDVNQYSFKKMAGDDMIKIQQHVKNLLELPRIQMGHSSSRMTEIYVSEHKEVLSDLIREQMPVL